MSSGQSVVLQEVRSNDSIRSWKSFVNSFFSEHFFVHSSLEQFEQRRRVGEVVRGNKHQQSFESCHQKKTKFTVSPISPGTWKRDVEKSNDKVERSVILLMSKRLFLYAGPFDRFPLSWQKKSNSAVTPEVQGWPICEMSLTVLGIVLLPATMLKQTCLLLACLAACLPASLGLRLLPDMEEQCSQPLGLQDGSIRSETFIFLSEPPY